MIQNSITLSINEPCIIVDKKVWVKFVNFADLALNFYHRLIKVLIYWKRRNQSPHGSVCF